MQRHVVALALAAGLVFGGSAAGAAGGVSPSGRSGTPGTTSASSEGTVPSGSTTVPGPRFAGRAGESLMPLPRAALGIPDQAPAPTVDEVLAALNGSPAGPLLAPLGLPGVGRAGRAWGRPLLDLANRPRTGRKFPAIPTAVPGGQGDPFAALP